MKQTIHDGSRSYSIDVRNPEPGKGKHAKTPRQIFMRHARNQIRKGTRSVEKETFERS